MIEGLELFYQQIAESMLEAIPEEWSTATFEATFFSDSSRYEAEYTRATDGLARGFQPTDTGCRAFRHLRKKFKEAGKQVWGQACFELLPNGKFNMKWGYDNCDENGDTLFDGDEEVKRAADRHERLSRG
jgi:hypothetical protein